MRILIGLGVHALGDGAEPPPVHPFLFDPRTLAAEAAMCQGEAFDDVHRPDVFFVSGLQVDRRGNVNLLGIPGGDGGWKVRGPGGVALASMSTNCGGYYIVMPRHEPRTFVERVSLISALGDRTERARLRFPGGGPRLVLSPLGVFDFDDAGDLRVRSLHEGVTAEQVVEATGFELRPRRRAGDDAGADGRGADDAPRARRRARHAARTRKRRAMEPRILPVETFDAEQAQAASKAPQRPDGRPLNVFGTLAHRPALMARVNALGGYFVNRGLLDFRTRELVILRTAGTTNSDYELYHHRAAGERAGLSAAEIDAAADACTEHAWADADRALLDVVDELLASRTISDAHWAALTAVFDDDRCLEVLMLTGFYAMLAGMLNGLGVEPDPTVWS